MSTIYEKVSEIKNEKDLKIIPGNIKSGVQIFDITGTLESGAKLFETIEDMNEDESAVLGDIAVVYNSSEEVWNIGTIAFFIKFPKSFSFSQAITDIGKTIYLKSATTGERIGNIDVYRWNNQLFYIYKFILL